MIELHDTQSVVFNDLFLDNTARFVTVCCSRGWGKSYLGAVCSVKAIWELMEMDESIPNKNVYIIAPTLDQVKDIYYPILAYDFGLESVANKSSRDLGRFKFSKNTELRLTSFETIERMRGKGAYFVVNDEVASWSSKSAKIRDAYKSIIKPCIVSRWSKQRARFYNAPSPGRALNIGTPKGYNYFYELFITSNKSYQYDYTQSPYLDASEIEKERNEMTDVEFATEYLALFKESGLLVFYAFDRNIHVVDGLQFEPEEIVHVGIDFNVSIQASVAFAFRNDKFYFIEEFKGYPDTETLAMMLVDKYRNHKIYAYPDPTGKSRKTSAPVGQTDFTILQKYGIQTFARRTSPPIIDSVKAVNRKLKTANGDVSMFFNKAMTNTISSVERTSWVEGDNATLDKTEGIEHFSDAIRYPVEYLCPVRSLAKAVRGFGF